MCLRLRLHDTKVIGVGFWTHSVRKRVQIYGNCRVTVEKLLGAHVSREILDGLARDRNPTEDHTAATQFTLKVMDEASPPRSLDCLLARIPVASTVEGNRKRAICQLARA